GLTAEHIEITDDAIKLIAARYTREAGVRQLERNLGRVARKVAQKVAQGQTQKVIIDVPALKQYLGGPKFYPEEARNELRAGLALYRPARAARYRHDWRDHPVRFGLSRWRHQGENPRRSSRRHSSNNSAGPQSI